MEYKDYYKILGIPPDAKPDDVKKAYRKLARKYHPDVSKELDASARMSEVNEAYEVLFDTEKRANFDALGKAPPPGQAFRPPPGWEGNFGGGRAGGAGNHAHGSAGDDYSEFFENLFGQSGGRPGHGGRRAGSGSGISPGGPQRGEDQHAQIQIALHEAYHGTSRTLSLRTAQRMVSGVDGMQERTLEIKIPKGVKEGQLVRLAGQGNPGFDGGAAGDLFLEVSFSADPRYRVEGRDVYQRLPVAPWEAALGAQVEMETPGGTLEISVPAGSQAGRKLRLKERGIPGTPAGHLYLELAVVLPPATTEAARAVYETMARELPFDPRKTAEG